MKLPLLLLLILIFTGAGAQPGQQFEISFSVTERAMPSQRSAPPKYKKFWPAVQAMDWEDARRRADTEEWRQALSAFSQLRQGRYSVAEAAFRHLGEATTHEKLKGLYQGLGNQLIFLRSGWQELTEQDTASTLAQAYVQVPEGSFEKRSNPQNTYPLRLSVTGCPMAEVSVNGKKHWFWLDTGASLSVLSSEMADALGVHYIEGKADIGTSNSAKVRTGFAYADSLTLGPYHFTNPPLLVIDTANLRFTLDEGRELQIDGIIGWPALMHMRLELNYGKGYYRILEAEHYPARNFFWMSYPIVEVQSENGIPLAFGLDSGSSNTAIHPPIFKKLRLKKVYSDTIKVGGAGGFESYETRIAPVLGLQLGNYLFSLKEVQEERQEQTFFLQVDGTIGSDIARGGRMILDFPKGYFALLPGED